LLLNIITPIMVHYKNYIITIALLAITFVPFTLGAQGIKPQNIYRVAVRSWYVIENGKRTPKYFAAEQLISDSLGRLHTEIVFDRATQTPSNYKWHYFDNLTKVQTRYFTSEGLERIEVYEKNSENRISKLILKSVSPGDTSLLMSVAYKYNPNGTVASTRGINPKGKKGFVAKYKYDLQGTEIERKVKGSKLLPPDSILYLKRVPVYDSLNRITREVVKTKMFAKGEATNVYTYKFNEKGLLVEKTISDGSENLKNRIEYIYRSDSRINQIIVYDAQGNLLSHEAWRYEIYKTNDRRNRVLE